MADVKDAYTSREMAEMLGLTRQAVDYRAKSEHWQSRPRKGRGGGNEWLTASMPEKTRLAVASALVAEMAKAADAERRKQSVNTAPAERGPASRQDRAASRAVIVQMARNFAAAQHPLPKTSAYELFAMRYNCGDLAAPDWVRAKLPRVCRGSLVNWERALAAEGPGALAGKHGRHRIGTGALDQPYVKTYVLGHIYKYPHAGATHIHKDLAARFMLQARPEKLPSLRRMQAWYQDWRARNEELFLSVSDPDKWRSTCRVAFGDAAMLVSRVNQEWEMDSTPADLILSDGRRHTIVACVDVFTRRVIYHVSRTSSSHAVASCLRRAIEKWGVPETVRTDNGQDYVSRHIDRVLLDMDIYHDICDPFCPEQKPFVERVFRTLLHDTMELMQGFVGHNVAERKALESRKSFATRMMTRDARVELNLSAEELQAVCDRWANDTYMHAKHSRLGCSPYEQARAYDGPIRRVKNEEALRLLFLPVVDGDGTRIVGKKGIHLYDDVYIATALGTHEGECVQVRVDDEDRRQAHVFTLDGSDYICTARGVRHGSMTNAEIRDAAMAGKHLQKAMLAAGRAELRAAAESAKVEEAAYERMRADDLRARKIEAEQPMRAEIMDIHSTPALEGAEQAARRPDYTPAPMTEAERAAHESAQDTLARALSENLATATMEMPEQRYLRAYNVECSLEAYSRDGNPAHLLPQEEYEWYERYKTTPEYRAQKRLHEVFGESRLVQLRAMRG